MEPETLRLDANGWVPNNPRLPVLLYRGVLPGGDTEDDGCSFRSALSKQSLAAAMALRRLFLSPLPFDGA